MRRPMRMAMTAFLALAWATPMSLMLGKDPGNDPLASSFNGKRGQVEVGGPFAGAEFHASRPLPSRISFFAPAANSIDLSTDYWARGDSRPMSLGLRLNGGSPVRIGMEGWGYVLSPHTVRFEGTVDGLSCSLVYEFCRESPAMVFRLVLSNRTPAPVSVEAYTHLRLLLRTCQTYARCDSAATTCDSRWGVIVARFPQHETRDASCFVMNRGIQPSSWTADAADLAIADDGSSSWFTSPTALPGHRRTSPGSGRGVAAFVYTFSIAPGDSSEIVQVIGSAGTAGIEKVIRRLSRGWREDVAGYDRFVRSKALQETEFRTGDPSIDRTAAWAKGILATNAHWIDGSVLPMPCPAEYNFFFTHDVLLTDLAAVNWDLPRVRRDLRTIASHAKDGIIPHAYYWRDSAFTTEYCTPENWNNLWFVIASSRYLCRSLDRETARLVYPLASRSIAEALRQLGPDHLMYSGRPDWWDIGHVEGSRAYLSILTIRALREFVAMSVRCGHASEKLAQEEAIADSMQAALNDKAWDPARRYFVDTNGGVPDRHTYVGPLLAAVFGVLDDERSEEVTETAWRELGDEAIGVRTAAPPDFHTPEAIAEYQFQGTEAGLPYSYINGGVWPHCNAWYAMALVRCGKTDEAFAFVKRTMTLDGIAESPGGIPAMYEYRFADSTSPRHGEIDKPSFLWAGGFTLAALYHVFGLEEGEWNVTLTGSLPSSHGSATYTLAFGAKKQVNALRCPHGSVLMVDGKEVPSSVLPETARHAQMIVLADASPSRPRLLGVNAVLRSVRRSHAGRGLAMVLSSFQGHEVSVRIAGGSSSVSATVNGLAAQPTVKKERGSPTTLIRFRGTDHDDMVNVVFR